MLSAAGCERVGETGWHCRVSMLWSCEPEAVMVVARDDEQLLSSAKIEVGWW